MQIMGLSLFNLEFPSPAGRFLLFTTKVMNRTFPSKIYIIFFLDTANLEFNQCHLWSSRIFCPGLPELHEKCPKNNPCNPFIIRVMTVWGEAKILVIHVNCSSKKLW